LTLHDFLPDEKLREVENLHDLAGKLVFNKWTWNTNVRQTVFEEAIAKPVQRAAKDGHACTGNRDRRASTKQR